jgi:hypothetical protein
MEITDLRSVLLRYRFPLLQHPEALQLLQSVVWALSLKLLLSTRASQLLPPLCKQTPYLHTRGYIRYQARKRLPYYIERQPECGAPGTSAG